MRVICPNIFFKDFQDFQLNGILAARCKCEVRLRCPRVPSEHYVTDHVLKDLGTFLKIVAT